MTRKTKFEVGQQYHLYARGVDKRDTFLSEYDYLRFMILLYVCNQKERIRLRTFTKDNLDQLCNIPEKPIIQIDQFCLMPNHFHILCTEITEEGISKLMQKIQTAYTMFFNKKHNRTGALFSSTYKVRHVNDNLYAEYIKKYIFYNPLKLIKPNYVAKNVLMDEKETITPEELLFLEEYPYKG